MKNFTFRSTVGATLLASALLNSPLAFSTNQAATGPHGGQVKESEGSRIELKLDRGRNQVDVYLLKTSDGQHPDAIGLTFFDDQGRSHRTLKIRAMGPLNPETQPHFQGSLDPAAASSAGIEIRIPFSKDSPVLFRTKDF